MFRLSDIRARLPRLQQRIEGVAREVVLWQSTESPLLPLEKRAYLIALHEIILGLDAGLVVLEKAAQRIEALHLPWEGDSPP